MALVGTLVPRAEVDFYTETPSADSLRLLEAAYEYVESLEPRPTLGICVCSSVAWGTAAAASDLDLGVIVSEDVEPHSRKRMFRSDFVDHCEWPLSMIDKAVESPASNAILSYSLAFPIILFDPHGHVAEAAHLLSSTLLDGASVRAWIARYLDTARDVRTALAVKLEQGEPGNCQWRLLAWGHHVANAVLHGVPGGLCGEWPRQLRLFAEGEGRPWLMEQMRAIIAPNGIDVAGLSRVIEPLERLHCESSEGRRSKSIGGSATSGRFFARKARFHAEQGDGLSVLRTLARMLDYVNGNLAASELPAESVAGMRHELAEVEARIRGVWSLDSVSAATAKSLMGEFEDAIREYLSKRS